MKKIISLALALIMVLALGIGLSGCGSEDAADDKVYEFTLSMHDPKTTANAVYLQAWIDKVAEATDGHVKITLHDNATLSAATDIGDNVKAGAVDIGWLYTSYYAGQFPLADVINLPMQGFGDPIVSTEVLWALSEKYEEVEGEWDDFKLLMLYGNPGMIFASAEKPITSVADLKGKNVAVGDAGSGVYYNATQILAAAGLDIDKDINKTAASFGDAATQLKDGSIDAAFLTAGTPTPAITELATATEVVVVDLGEEVISKLMTDYPFYAKYEMTEKDYDFIAEPVNTVAIMATFVVTNDMSEEQAYQITKDLWEKQADIAVAHAKGNEMNTEI